MADAAAPSAAVPESRLAGLWGPKVGIIPMPIAAVVVLIAAVFIARGKAPSDILMNIAVLAVGGFACAEVGKRLPLLSKIGAAAILATFVPSYLVYAHLIPKALETGKFELRPNCMALQIQHNAEGKVTGVLYADADGKHQVQKARVVCVAGNAIESPRLLLNSASNLFKDGMANSSGQVGRNYMRHASQHIYATFEQPVNAHRGIHAPGIMRSEARNDPSRGFAGGYHLEIFDVGLPFTGIGWP